MPDDRMIHRRMLRGDRIAALTDFERGVWLAYQLIADDFGVMRFSAVDLQRAIWLEKKPRKTVQRGFEAVVATGLIHTFQDGQRAYVYQRDWQTWQKVRHPRGTIEPCPPTDALLQCDVNTRVLFWDHPRKPADFYPELSGKTSEEVQQHFGLTRARALANANGKRLPASSGEGGAGETPSAKVAFEGSRLKVWRWQHEDLARRLGAKADDFDLLGWYPRLNAELEHSGESYADQWKWLLERLYREADLEQPNLMGKRTRALARADAGFLGRPS